MPNDQSTRSLEYHRRYWIDDLISNTTLIGAPKDFGAGTAETCLSPTGCYEFEFHDDEDSVFDDIRFTFNLSYCKSNNNLDEQHSCDAVKVWENSFNFNVKFIDFGCGS